MAAEVKTDLVYNLITNAAQFIEGMNRVMGSLNNMDRGMQGVQKNTSFASQALSTFAGVVAANVVGKLTQAFGILKTGFDRFVDIAKGATMEAARIEVQWRTLSLTAGNAGKNISDVTKYIQDLRTAGIKTGEALEIVTQFLANELPIEKITELARRAQDMAVVIGSDSTEAFKRFNLFLQTGNSEWIRTMGITKTATQMIEEYAQAQGKTAKALTDRERKEALVLGLMKETTRYEGAYEEAMKDPYKRWTSLPRLISNVTEALGSVFVPMMGTVVDVFSDALEKMERLFRVTSKEAKETGATIGTWKEGFLRLRAVVTAFANWFMSIWNRIVGGFNDASEGMMDRFVNAIVRGVQAAAAALRKFAQFVAGIFGGRAPAEVTPAAIAATKPAPKAAAPKREAALAGPPIPTMAAPEEAAKLRAKPVAASKAEDIAAYAQATAQLTAMTQKLAQASTVAARARTVLAGAEAILAAASEHVYEIRRRMEKLELDWAEVPERFVRGRQRQLQLELTAAEDAEHRRQKETEAAREKLKLAEDYEREVEKATDALERQAEKLSDSIARQTEKYQEYLDKLHEAEAISLVEPVQAIINEFESLDDLTAGYLTEIEGQLMPAFADIEASALSIYDSFSKIPEFIGSIPDKVEKWLEKQLGINIELEKVGKFLEELPGKITGWFEGQPDWVKNILKGLGIALALNFITGGLVGSLASALIPLGLSLGPLGWAVTILATLVLLNKEELNKWINPETPQENRISQAAFAGVNWLSDILPEGGIKNWWDENVLKPGTEVMTGSKQEISDSVMFGVSQPIIDAFNEANKEVVGQSILPDMIQSILDWFGRLATDVIPPLTQFADAGIAQFQRMADSWQFNITKLTDGLRRLTSHLELMSAAIRGIPVIPSGLQLQANGSLRIINVDLKGSKFGGDLTESQVRDWMYDAIRGMVSA